MNFNLGVNFLVSGEWPTPGRLPYGSLTNNSTATGGNIELTSFSLGTSPLVADTVGTGATPFTPFGTTAVDTGLQTVNGSTTFATAVADGASNLNMTFNDCTNAESMQWNLDSKYPLRGRRPQLSERGLTSSAKL